MKFGRLLTKYLSPFLLVAYTSILMAGKMLWERNTGFGLPFIGFLLLFASGFILLDLGFKRWFKGHIKIMLVLEAIIAVILLSTSLYLEFKGSAPDTKTFEVEPIEVAD